MSSSEEYTDDYGKIEDTGLRFNKQLESDAYNFCCNINNEMKKIENGYFIKCLETQTSGNCEYTTKLLLIDNYGNFTYYSMKRHSGATSSHGRVDSDIPSNFNQKNKNYKLSNKLIDLVKSIKVHPRYNFDNGEQKYINESELYINDFLSKIQILAEDNYKKYMEINVLKAQNNILEKTKELKDNEQKERIDQQNELISKLMDEIYDLKNKN
jgi:hypothetical protein